MYTDLILGILKKCVPPLPLPLLSPPSPSPPNTSLPSPRIRRKRPSLRLIVSSATLDATFFLDYFKSGSPLPEKECTIVSLEGRMFPVEVAYLKESTSDYVREAVGVVWGIHVQVSRALCYILWL